MKLENVILRGNRASQPVATTVPTGTLYFVTDEFVTERSNGTSWESYSGSAAAGATAQTVFLPGEDGIFESLFIPPAAPVQGGLVNLYPPADAAFAWTNQGGASVVATPGKAIYLLDPANASSSLRIRSLALPSAPYTLTAAFIPNIINANFPSAGLCLRDSASGKVVTFSYGFSTNLNIGLAKFTNPTTFSASYSGALNINLAGPYLWLRINDTGVNRISSFSLDGINFRQVQSIANTDFLTPDQIGFYADSNNASNDCAVTLVSWSF